MHYLFACDDCGTRTLIAGKISRYSVKMGPPRTTAMIISYKGIDWSEVKIGSRIVCVVSVMSSADLEIECLFFGDK